MNKNDKFDKDKYIEELADRLTKYSDEILSYDPSMVNIDRPDLMYTEDNMLLWRVNMVKQMAEYDMQTLVTILRKRNEYRKHQPHSGKLSQDF